MFELGPVDYLKVTGIALGVGIACGVAVALVLSLVPFLGMLSLFLMGGLGYAVAEAILKLTRKRGNMVGAIAALAAVTGVIAGPALLVMAFGANPVLAFAGSAVRSMGTFWGLVGLAIAALVAYSRVR